MMPTLKFVVVAGALCCMPGMPARATGMATGNAIIGIFSAPVLSGNSLNVQPGGGTTYSNNGATAVTTGVGTSTLTWGSTDGQTQTAANSSSLTFTGATNLPLNGLLPGPVGTISFSNGGSSLDTLIYGATLSFYFNTVSPGTLLGRDTVYISTTTNTYSGTNLSPAQLDTDADFINICGSSSNICTKSIEAYESDETGSTQPFVGDLFGVYQGDPSITLTGVAADPTSGGTGTIGAKTEFATPEPASIAVLLVGMLAMGLRATRRQFSI